MIAKLKGTIDTIGEDYCVIDVNGVGYLVFASLKTLGRLVRGSPAVLLTETVVREDSISLYGFLDALEKEWFMTLTKVQGVGSKVCLNILSALSPSQMAVAISAQDKASFQRASGVGPKLAARLVTELKDKVVMAPVEDFTKDIASTEESVAILDNSVARDNNPGKMEDAISALVNLGYQRLEAYRAVNAVLNDDEDMEVPDIIRLSLKEFAKKD
jgi:Holliday junction DNA helicase RuvA